MKRLLSSLAAVLALSATASCAIAADQWLPVREVSLEIRPGSPLDFSALLPSRANGPKGAIGVGQRVVARQDGRLALAQAPGEPARLFCASLAWSPASGGFPDRVGADRYAEQLARHGYNIARLTFLDASLMSGRGKDFDFDPDTLDRIHYLLAALKRNGIYWIIDGMTSWRGAYGGYDDRWDPAGNLKLALHLDDAAFAHWKNFTEKFLARVNPHTGIAPIHDDALALVILVNENGIEFEGVVQDRPGKPPYDAMLAAPFNRWLAKRYASTAALSKAWGGLGWTERLENGSIALPGNRYADSPRMRDLQAFFTEVETESAAKMSQALRTLGYKGLISTYNNWPTIQTALSRRGLEAVTMNTYHDWVGGYAPGSKLLQQSSVGDGANAMRMIAAARWLGKPFIVSEYDHLFWNRYRYEGGLVFPAYAALQGWDVLCRHAHGPIILAYGEPYPHKRAMLPYAIALDPVARAGETLSALLFRRGDVATSRITIPFAVRGEEDLGKDMQAREPENLTDLALVGRIGLQAADRIGEQIAVLQPRDTNRAAGIIDRLKKSGALSQGNATDIAAGLYQSDTGEIVLNRPSRQLRVSTPATEAVAFSSQSLPARLGTMSVDAAEGDGLVALASLDRPASLAKGSRFLLIFATDARNTGMTFRDRQEKVIEDFGRLPVLIRKGQVDLRINRTAPRWQLSPVSLDGTVKPPITRGAGPVTFRLSNDLPTGPTTYFLLELLEGG
ncbi:glycoside hydrolase [Bosea sp. 2KB_26]|uniref:glycoside hydrolase n=1 Tax=Bosea sp. 2KB_26 TaxID=3237475 RepID=UPI003F91AC9E